MAAGIREAVLLGAGKGAAALILPSTALVLVGGVLLLACRQWRKQQVPQAKRKMEQAPPLAGKEQILFTVLQDNIRLQRAAV